MGFTALFQQKLQVENEASVPVTATKDKPPSAQEQLIHELEPKLRTLVLEVFAVMRSAAVAPFDVTSDSSGLTRTGVTAHALGRLQPGARGGRPKAPVVIDSAGRVAFNHAVNAFGSSPASVRNCSPLNKGHERILSNAYRGDRPMRECLYLNPAGELMLSKPYKAPDGFAFYRRVPLAEYLAQLAVEAVAGA